VSNAQILDFACVLVRHHRLVGSATVKFKSATLTHGVYKPADVYYFFDATLEATIPGQSAGAADVQVNGRFQLQTLPLGS